MRWFKKIVRAILALLPVFSIFFICNGSSFALQHNYDGYYISDVIIPNNDGSFSDPDNQISNSLGLSFSNTYAPNLSSLKPYHSFAYSHPLFESGHCYLSNNLSYNLINSGLSYSSNDTTTIISLRSMPTIPNSSTATGQSVCFQTDTYSFNNPVRLSDKPFRAYLPFSTTYLDNDNSRLIYDNYMAPYPFEGDILDLEDSTVSDSNGLTYEHSFSFQRVWSGEQPNKFRSLSIPLFDKSGYFYNPSNLWSGRQFEWKFIFNFVGSFAWNSDLSNGEIKIYATARGSDHNWHDFVSDQCTANLYQVTGSTQLEISCSVTLERDYDFIVPYLYIYNDPYVWDSDSYFEIYSTYLVTDGDNSLGESFNNNPIGKLWNATNGVGGDGSGGNVDWLSSLTNMFSFSIPINNTPIGSIFSGFTDSMSCASIPTIASMIHSQETQVCPWFNSTVRNITTPILTLASVMLTFGFIVRWLSSSSGNETGGGL